MAIKKAQYKITLASGENVYHFETGDEMVKIVNSSGVVLGSFKEFGMEGKVIASGSFKDLKVTGLYKVSKLTGLPSGYNVDKISILSVKAIGKVGAPEMVSYDLISQAGDIFHNTVFGTTEVGWSEGGTSLKNKLTVITNQLGDLSKLNTTSKTSLVNAINEVSNKSNSTETGLKSLKDKYEEFTKHNHDTNYVIKSGDTITGNLVMANAKRIQYKSTTGSSVNLIGANDKNDIILGNAGVPLAAHGSAATFNGGKIWHENNDGADSGLDADLLGGHSYDLYPRLDKQNSFKQDMYINDDKSLNMYSSKTGNSPIYWRDDDKFRGEVYFDAARNFIVKSGGNVKFRAKSEELLEGWGSFTLSATRSGYSSFRLKRWDSSNGSGLEIDKVTENIVLKDWDKDATGFTFEKSTSEMSFPRQIKISGRKLYMQSGTPTGTRTVGDIWFA